LQDDLSLTESFVFVIEESEHGTRIDRYLASCPTLTCSRSYLKQLITDGHVLIGTKPCRPSYKVRAGETVTVSIPPPRSLSLTPEDIPLDVLYEDSHLIVVNKPVGMVVHPAPGHYTGTLVHALLHHCQDLSGIGGALRPGIVHRIDRDTSGSLVVAKTDDAHRGLSTLFKERPKDQIARQYLAVARGTFREEKGTIETPYGRHPTKRQCYSSRFPADRQAITHFEVIESFGLATLVALRLETGRTHQIRVHLADRHRGLIGDQVYGGRPLARWPNFLKSFPRQALHAHTLSFVHPVTGERIHCEAPLPDDMAELLHNLRSLAASSSSAIFPLPKN
jgi:23S rRNA pseudouridine1911/1915/1917 synthase